jgi:5'-nucleotidase
MKVRVMGLVGVTAVLAVSGVAAAGAGGRTAQSGTPPLRILVTNDDGVAAPGIAAVVDKLQTLSNVEVTVIAPAGNRSGTGDAVTTDPITVTPATTASGDAATAVSGFPADTVLYGVLEHLPMPPHVVVSGSNRGQNLGDITPVSGTVGAARTANRLGLPAIAISNGLGPNVNFPLAGTIAASWVSFFRADYINGNAPAQTVNINVPTCSSGRVRGFRAVPLGYSSTITGYTAQSGTTGNGTFAPTIEQQNPIPPANCTSTVTNVDNDIEAFANGFVTFTTLNPDFGDR